MPLEFFLTFLAAICALCNKRDSLVGVLFSSWVLSMLFASTTPVELLPGTASLIDLVIAMTCFWLWWVHESQRARIVGVISLLKLLYHVGISAHFGDGNWYSYAFMVNVSFVAQCIVAGGWFYGLVDFLNSISPRHPDRGVSADKKRAP